MIVNNKLMSVEKLLDFLQESMGGSGLPEDKLSILRNISLKAGFVSPFAKEFSQATIELNNRLGLHPPTATPRPASWG